MTGWFKTHRCIEEWKWVNDLPTLRLWLYILTRARYEEGSWNGLTLKAGQMVIGRKSFSRETGISEQTYRTSLRRLKDDGTITTKSTNHYTIVTVENWSFYQNGEEESTSKSTSVSTSNQPATNQQLTTNKESKKGNNVVEVVVGGCEDSDDDYWKNKLEYYGFPSNKSDVDKAKTLSYQYSEEWLVEALERTSDQQQEARNWNYVNKILKSWDDLGCIDAKGKDNALMERTSAKFRWVGDDDR